MKSLRMKLIGGFLVFLVMIVAVAFYSSFASQASLKESIGQSSVFVANEMLINMDMAIFYWIDRLELRAMDPLIRQAAMTNRQQAGESAPALSPERMIGNPVSEELRNLYFSHYERKDGTRPVDDVVVTNMYGVAIAATGAGTRYRYDGDALWLAAKESGARAGDIEVDESSGQSVIPLDVPVNDSRGDFAGMIIIRLSADSIIRNAVITYKKYENTQVRITTLDGRLLYSTKAFRFMDDASKAPYFRGVKGDSGSFDAVEGGRATLYSYARSQGYLTFPGMPWIIVLGNDVKEILAPSFGLRNNIILASGILLLLGMCVAVLISRSITRPVTALNKAAAEIARGNLGRVIDVRGRDELGQLARSFTEMQNALGGSRPSPSESLPEISRCRP